MKKLRYLALAFILAVIPLAAFGQAADGITPSNAGPVRSFPYLYNGTTFDRLQSSALTGATGVMKVTVAGVGDPCLSSELAKSSAIIAITTATTTQLVPLSSGKIVYVCSFTFTISQVVTTANTLKFVYGTGSSCGTGTTDLTGLFGAGGVTAAAPITVSGASDGTEFKTIASNALCATTAIGGSGSFQGVLSYVQL